jgi:arylsulfatase
MEVFAGFTEHVDVQVGRIVDEVEKLGYGDNTLIFYIWGDNGASSEGQNGTISELLAQNGIPTTVKQHIQAANELGGLDVLGSPKADNMYHAGWAWAGSTPYQATKLIASVFGPRIAWLPGLPKGIHEWTPDQDTWELYHLEEDWSQANDLAAKMPEKLADMKDLFLIEATRNNVLPIGGGL